MGQHGGCANTLNKVDNTILDYDISDSQHGATRMRQ